MMREDFGTAFRVSDDVLATRNLDAMSCAKLPRHLQHVWRGAPLQDRHVLVRCYHGLGDTIQFARYLEPLAAAAASVTLWVQPCLLELMRHVGGIDERLPLHDGEPAAPYDVDVEIMELMHALRLPPAALAPGPYIHIDECHLPDRERRDLRVGIAWRAGDWDASRSLDDGSLDALLAHDGISWVSLQFESGTLPPRLASVDAADIVATARVMRCLDLVISVDTMAAHLAGAIGAKIWTLLPRACDWRWGHGERTCWYPTMRLFRQQAADDWSLPIARIHDALDEALSEAPDDA